MPKIQTLLMIAPMALKTRMALTVTTTPVKMIILGNTGDDDDDSQYQIDY